MSIKLLKKVYSCENIVIRFSSACDSCFEDYLAETEYVHYLAQNGADCVDALPSMNGRFVENSENNCVFAFTLAQGDQITSHGYRYRESSPLSECFYNTDKTLGKNQA